MKKNQFQVLLIILVILFVSCKTKRKIEGNKELNSISKEWIAFSQNQTRVFQKNDGNTTTYTNSKVNSYFEEQIVDCDNRLIGGSECIGYNMQTILF